MNRRRNDGRVIPWNLQTELGKIGSSASSGGTLGCHYEPAATTRSNTLPPTGRLVFHALWTLVKHVLCVSYIHLRCSFQTILVVEGHRSEGPKDDRIQELQLLEIVTPVVTAHAAGVCMLSPTIYKGQRFDTQRMQKPGPDSVLHHVAETFFIQGRLFLD